jgi:hypothetical protein
MSIRFNPKRSQLIRSSRMKCLEFLYFYLMDETGQTMSAADQVPPDQEDLQQVLRPRPNDVANAKPKAGGRRAASSGSLSSTTSLSSSGSDDSSTTATSLASSNGSASSSSSTSSRSASATSKPRRRVVSPDSPFAPNPALLLLKRDVEYEPLSPAKPAGAGFRLERGDPATPLPRKRGAIGLGMPGGSGGGAPPPTSALGRSGSAALGHRRGESLAVSRASTSRPPAGGASPFTPGHRKGASLASLPALSPVAAARREPSREGALFAAEGRLTRTTEEKKELLGGLLGNVDALVEGVRKAGVWGLG